MITKEGSAKIVTFMTPWARVLALVCGHLYVSRIVKIHYFPLNSSSLLPGIDQTNLVYSNDDLGRVFPSCKFHDPRIRGFLC